MGSSLAPLFSQTIPVISALWPFGLCLLFLGMIYEVRVDYKRREFLSKQKMSLLELRLPKEITKSPLAMELLFSALHITNGDSSNMWDKLTNGKSRPGYSLEIVSVGGQVHFFIRTRTFYKKFVEAQMYAQYPGIEVVEVPDYTEGIEYDPNQIALWGCDFELAKSDVYPLKTYVDYGLDKDPKEEMKVDPMTPMIEFLGSLTHGEQIWIQFIIKAHKAEGPKKDGKSTDHWKDNAKTEIDEIRKKATPETAGDFPGFPNPTKGQNEAIAAIERNVAKLGFDCGVRAIYLADKDVFDAAHIAGMVSVFKQYNSDASNGFALKRPTAFDYPWQDFFGTKLLKKKKKIVQLYRDRLFFSDTHTKLKDREKPFVLNVESLATIFHFPGNVSQTPTFSRVLSKKAEPPANLPI